MKNKLITLAYAAIFTAYLSQSAQAEVTIYGQIEKVCNAAIEIGDILNNTYTCNREEETRNGVTYVNCVAKDQNGTIVDGNVSAAGSDGDCQAWCEEGDRGLGYQGDRAFYVAEKCLVDIASGKGSLD